MVLKLSDTLDGCENRTNVYNNFTAQEYGLIEGWIYVDQGEARVCLGDGWNTTLIFNNTGCYFYNGTDTVLVKVDDFTDEWHHFGVEFECGSGAHYDLSEDSIRIYLNLTAQGEFYIGRELTSIDSVYLGTWTMNDTSNYGDSEKRISHLAIRASITCTCL